MKIEIKQKVDVPMGFFCKGCARKERDQKGHVFCGIFNRFIWMRRGEYLKCIECVNATYDHIDKEG